MATQAIRSASVIWTNFSGGTFPNIIASGNSGVLSALQFERVGLLVAVVGAVTGTTPTLTFTINGVDAQGNLFPLVTGVNITATGVQQLQAGPGLGAIVNVAQPLFVPNKVQVNWVIG